MTNLGRVLQRWRVNEGVTLRQAAKSVGISAATWMRLEHGHKPEGDTLVKLLVWLMRPTFPPAREMAIRVCREKHPREETTR